MPGPGEEPYAQLWSVLTEPIFKGLIPGLLGEYFRPKRSLDIEDESLGSFLERRFGNSDVVDNLASAMMHGIYAGDIYQLSVKSLFPLLWEAERRSDSLAEWTMDRFSPANAKSVFMQRRDIDLTKELRKDPELVEFVKALQPMSLWSFPDGISTLSNALEAALKASPNVSVKMNEELTKVAMNDSNGQLTVSI